MDDGRPQNREKGWNGGWDGWWDDGVPEEAEVEAWGERSLEIKKETEGVGWR